MVSLRMPSTGFLSVLVITLSAIVTCRAEPEGEYFQITSKYSTLVADSNRPVSLSYVEAESFCKSRNQQVWDLNVSKEPTTKPIPANNTIARDVLDRVRELQAIRVAIQNSEFVKRLNLVYGRRVNETFCKVYLAGPFTEDFHTFTFSDKCPSSSEKHWFICEKEIEDSPGESTTTIRNTSTSPRITTPEHPPTEPITSTPTPKDAPTTTETPTTTPKENSTSPGTSTPQVITITKTSEPPSTPTPPEEITNSTETVDIPTEKPKAPEDTFDHQLDDIVDDADDAGELIDEVTDFFKRIIDQEDQSVSRVGGWKDKVLEKVEGYLKQNKSQAVNVTHQLFESTVQTLQDRVKRPDDFASVVSLVEGISKQVANYMPEGTEASSHGDEGIQYSVRKMNVTRNLSSSLRTSEISLNNLDLVGDVVVTHVEFRDRRIADAVTETHRKAHLATDLVEFHVLRNGSKVEGTVDLFFRRNSEWFSRSHQECVYFDIAAGALSQRGCHFEGIKDDKIHCRCDHMTSFASIVLPLNFMNEFGPWLSWLTMTLLPLSVVALVACVVTFAFFRKPRSTNATIHLNLCSSLLVGHLVIVASTVIVDDQEECSQILGALTHFAFLTAIIWMGLEGMQLSRDMIFVFKPARSRIQWYIVAGYTLPILFPAAVLLQYRHAYTIRNQLCFLADDRILFISFVFPLMVSLLISTLAIGIIFYRLSTTEHKQRDLKSEFVRHLRNLISLASILGLQWLFGITAFLLKPRHIDYQLALAVLFEVLMLLQGPTILTVHILLVKENRFALARSLQKRGKIGRYFADILRPPPPRERAPPLRKNMTQTTTLESSTQSVQSPSESKMLKELKISETP